MLGTASNIDLLLINRYHGLVQDPRGRNYNARLRGPSNSSFHRARPQGVTWSHREERK